MHVVETHEPRKHLRDSEGYAIDLLMLLTKLSKHHRLVAQQVGGSGGSLDARTITAAALVSLRLRFDSC